MGKLYDRIDHDWELWQIDLMEQGISSQVLAGTFDPLKVPQTVGLFEKCRQQVRMKLLRSGTLMKDLDAAKRSGNPERIKKAKTAIFWAGKDNVEWRASVNRSRPGDFETIRVPEGSTPIPRGASSSLNRFEEWYYKDRRDGVWPGKSPEELDYNREQFDSLDYSGWLRMLLLNEEITLAEYEAERARLRGEPVDA